MSGVLLVIKSNSNLYLFTCFPGTLWDEFLKFMSGAGFDLSQTDNWKLSYNLPDIQNVVLSSSEHWPHFKNVVAAYNLSKVELSIEKEINATNPTALLRTGKKRKAPAFCVGSSSDITSNSSEQTFECYRENLVNFEDVADVDNELLWDENVILVDWNLEIAELDFTEGWELLITSVSQQFKSGVVQFKRDLSMYSLKVGFDYEYLVNTSTRVTVSCNGNSISGCPCDYYMVALKDRYSNMFYISDLIEDHNHVMDSTVSRRMNAKLISFLMMEVVRKDINVSPKDVSKCFNGKYGFGIPYMIIYRDVQNACAYLTGSDKKEFTDLNWLVSELQVIDPNGYFVIEKDKDDRFIRMFLSFGASIQGYKSCRPMLFIDGTHLKYKYSGTLLSATAKDEDNGLFPLTFCVCDVENNDNWTWMLEHLNMVLDGDEHLLTIVSDQHSGIISGVSQVFPFAKHYYCMYHLQQNLKTYFKGERQNSLRSHASYLFGLAARDANMCLFNEYFSELLEKTRNILHDFFQDLPYDRWAFAFSRTTRYGEMTSNAAKSYNNWIEEARHLPLYMLVMEIRSKINDWFVKRRLHGSQLKGYLCSKKQAIIAYYNHRGKRWIVKRCSDDIFEVIDVMRYRVDISSGTCSCLNWQYNGYPCSHVVVAATKHAIRPETLFDEYFSSKSYKSCYKGIIVPVSTNDRCLQREQIPKLLPPITKRPPRRPKKQARKASKGEVEPAKARICGKCHKIVNHNKRTCKG